MRHPFFYIYRFYAVVRCVFFNHKWAMTCVPGDDHFRLRCSCGALNPDQSGARTFRQVFSAFSENNVCGIRFKRNNKDDTCDLYITRGDGELLLIADVKTVDSEYSARELAEIYNQNLDFFRG